MSERKSTRLFLIGCLSVLLLASSALAAPNCARVGGAFMTNIGGFGANTTLGVITGDIKGAVGVQILNVATGANGTTTITVQHHLVTETGDTVFIHEAHAIGVFVAPGLFAITNYHFHVFGGTGRFHGATGDMSAIGEADFNTGHLIGRYTGQLCTVATGTP
jgi:hypothetical protein